jgi:hypothetical protein
LPPAQQVLHMSAFYPTTQDHETWS